MHITDERCEIQEPKRTSLPSVNSATRKLVTETRLWLLLVRVKGCDSLRESGVAENVSQLPTGTFHAPTFFSVNGRVGPSECRWHWWKDSFRERKQILP